MAAAGRRKILTLDDRVDVLKRIDNGESCRGIAAAVNCGKSQISRIRSDRAAILKEWESGARYDLKYVKRRKDTYEELNTLAWEWFNKARSKELPICSGLLHYIVFSFSIQKKKVKVCFYIAQYPVRWTAQSALHLSSPGRPVHSDTNSASLGSILAMQRLRNDYSLTCTPLSIAR